VITTIRKIVMVKTSVAQPPGHVQRRPPLPRADHKQPQPQPFQGHHAPGQDQPGNQRIGQHDQQPESVQMLLPDCPGLLRLVRRTHRRLQIDGHRLADPMRAPGEQRGQALHLRRRRLLAAVQAQERHVQRAVHGVLHQRPPQQGHALLPVAAARVDYPQPQQRLRIRRRRQRLPLPDADPPLAQQVPGIPGDAIGMLFRLLLHKLAHAVKQIARQHQIGRRPGGVIRRRPARLRGHAQEHAGERNQRHQRR
jgi:hypothetical protein